MTRGRMNFSVLGSLVGAVCALFFWNAVTTLFYFGNGGLVVFGLLALLLWGYITFQWPARGTRIAIAVAVILVVLAVIAMLAVAEMTTTQICLRRSDLLALQPDIDIELRRRR